MLKFISYAVIVFTVAFSGAIFTFRNDLQVALDLFVIEPVTMGLGFWIILSFLIGCFVAWLISWPSFMTYKIKNKNLVRQLKQNQDEILRLKGEPRKGS